MFSILQPRTEHPALRWSQPSSGLWLMVYGWLFFPWCLWWKLLLMAMVDGFWLMAYHWRFMVDGLWLMINGFWLMVYFIFCSQEVTMNILPKLTDGLNQPMFYGWWLMFFFLQPRTEHPALRWSQPSSGLWLMVYGWLFFGWCLWWKLLLMVYIKLMVSGYNGIPLKAYGWWFMVDG